MLPRPLLWLRWWPLVARRVTVDWGFGLGFRTWTEEEMVIPSSGCEIGERSDKEAVGKSKFCGGETLKLSPSSRVVWRLPSELPVASDESLWDGYCREEVVWINVSTWSQFSAFMKSAAASLQIIPKQLYPKTISYYSCFNLINFHNSTPLLVYFLPILPVHRASFYELHGSGTRPRRMGRSV